VASPEEKLMRYSFPDDVAPYNVSPAVNAIALISPTGIVLTRTAKPESQVIPYNVVVVEFVDVP
jgi:hypothetical protein